MNNQKVKLLLTLSVCAFVGAVLWSIAAGSHFHFSLANGSSNFDFRVGVESNPVSSVLGIAAVMLFLGALGLHLSGGAGTGGSAGAPNEPSPFAWLADLGSGLRRLTKSRKDVWLGGVCGGLGEATPLPSWVWRFAFLAALFCYGTGVIAYILLWICLPEPPEEPVSEPSSRPLGG